MPSPKTHARLSYSDEVMADINQYVRNRVFGNFYFFVPAYWGLDDDIQSFQQLRTPTTIYSQNKLMLSATNEAVMLPRFCFGGLCVPPPQQLRASIGCIPMSLQKRRMCRVVTRLTTFASVSES